MRTFKKKLAVAIFTVVIVGGLSAPAFAEPPGTNDRPCNGSSKHHGPQGGGACPHP